MEACRVEERGHPSGIPVVAVTGYLAKEGGVLLKDCVYKLLAAGKIRILVDFSACSVISSPGVSAVLDIVCRTHEDHNGTCVLVGLDGTKKRFLTMMGVLPMAYEADAVDQAIAILQRDAV